MPLTNADTEIIEFTVTCKMQRRWAKQFLGMLTTMQRFGSWGSSREIVFFSDGDGDYRPKFEWNGVDGVTPAEPAILQGERHFFDAG